MYFLGQIPPNLLVCKKHFTTDSYERDLAAELLNLPPRIKLKPDAIPSLLLPQLSKLGKHVFLLIIKADT